MTLTQAEIDEIRNDFPALRQTVHGQRLAYLDNAASSLTPQTVIDAMVDFYQNDRANVHRGVHTLSQRASTKYEAARKKIHHFLGADDDTEIVLTSGTTQGFNILARGIAGAFARKTERPDAIPSIALTELEHHANIVPWQMLGENGPHHTHNPFLNYFSFSEAYGLQTSPNTKDSDVLSITGLSNATGVIIDTNAVVELFSTPPEYILIDGAQDVVHRHRPLENRIFDAYVFSAHKICGPTGAGAIAIKSHLLEEIHPTQGGGDMIKCVGWHRTEYQTGVHKLEAGTPPIAPMIGFGAAIDYLEGLDAAACHAHEQALYEKAQDALSKIDGVRIIAPDLEKAGALSFVIDGVHPHDMGMLLDEQGVAVRTGQHCAGPLMEKLGVPGTIRASFMFYNTEEDVDQLVKATQTAVKMLT